MEATVAKIKKNKSNELWVSLRDYQGQQYVDIREHFLLGDDRQWHPTKKGIMVLPASLPEVINGVEALSGKTELCTVAEIRKSSRDEIQVGVREYESHKYGDIRIWYWAEDGEKKPGKGITFRLELVDSLVEALRSAEDHLGQKKT